MRLGVFSVLLGLVATPVLAVTFQTPLEKVEWAVEGDRFECRLTQPVKDFGLGEFVRRAGEGPVFRLHTQERWLARGSATLFAAAATWRERDGHINLGPVLVTDNGTALQSSQSQATRLLTAMLEGRGPIVRHRTLDGEPLEVRVVPAHFADAYQRYLTCAAGLFAYNFDQLKQTRIGFADTNMVLTESAQGRLQAIVDFMREDPTVNQIELDGHSDSWGNRLSNRELSRRRALTVKDFFLAQGITEEQIIVRFHGERYPLKPNNTAANRALNRRVNIVLSRVPESAQGAEEQAQED